MLMPRTWRDAKEVILGTLTLSLFFAVALFLFLFVLPAHADGPRDHDRGRACFACGFWGAAYYPLPIVPSAAPLLLPSAPSPVQVVRQIPSQVVPQVVPQVVSGSPPMMAPPTATPTPLPVPPPPPPPTMAPAAPAASPTYQAPATNPAVQGPATQSEQPDADVTNTVANVAAGAETTAEASANLSGMDVPSLIQTLGGSHSECIDSIVKGEAQYNPNAVNPSSGNAGLGQWAIGTWLSTPQGKAGLSMTDPVANVEAMSWVLDGHIGGMQNWAGTRYTAGCYSWLPQLDRLLAA
jgi:hypothetical protein